MSGAGAGPFMRKEGGTSGPGTGAEYGVPPTALEANTAGEFTVQVPADVADRFEAAKASHDAMAGDVGSNIDETHKSGLEPVSERARDLTPIAQAKMQSGGEAETRTPEVGFPGSSE